MSTLPKTERIVRVPPPRILDALSRVVLMGRGPDWTGASRFAEYAAEQGISLDQCWAVEDAGGRFGPVVIALPNRGHTVMVFISPPRRRDDLPVLARLIEHAHENLDRSRIHLAQALLERGQRLEREGFEAAGYIHLADLTYLERRLHRRSYPPRPDWPPGVTLETWTPENESGFRDALTESYHGTLDCPALCGMRTIDDILADHKGGGGGGQEITPSPSHSLTSSPSPLAPDLWTLLRLNGRPAAVLLLNPLADGETVELSYLGVAAAYRRHGLGRRLMQRAFTQLADRPYTRMTLAVDEANAPALALYRSLGFYRTDRRVAMVRPVRENGAARD